MVFASILIWNHTLRKIQTEFTKTNRLTNTYKYILAPPVICTQQLPLHCIQITDLKTSLTEVHNVFAFKKLITLEAYLLIKFHKTKSLLWNTKNTERNGVNEQNTYTKHIEKDTFRSPPLPSPSPPPPPPPIILYKLGFQLWGDCFFCNED